MKKSNSKLLKTKSGTGLLALMLLTAALSGCKSQVGQNSSASNAPSGSASNQSSNKTDSDSSAVVQSSMSSAEEEEAWKKEPAYGQTIKIGYNGGLCLGAFGIAQVKGFYEAEGLKTEIVNMNSQQDAIGTGQVDVTGDHIASFLVPAVNGVNATFTTGCHTGCKSLYVLADSSIEKTSDLKGKTVGLPDGIGNSDHNIALRFLNHDDINPKDVNFKAVTSDAVVQAMLNNEVQAAILNDQFAKKFVDNDTIKIIRSLTFDKDFEHEPCCIHAINSNFLEKNPITAKKLTRAHQNASNWIEDNKEEFVDLMLENNWASGDRKLVLEIANTYNFKISDEDTQTTLKNIINDYKEFGILDSSINTDQALAKIWDPLLQK